MDRHNMLQEKSKLWLIRTLDDRKLKQSNEGGQNLLTRRPMLFLVSHLFSESSRVRMSHIMTVNHFVVFLSLEVALPLLFTAKRCCTCHQMVHGFEPGRSPHSSQARTAKTPHIDSNASTSHIVAADLPTVERNLCIRTKHAGLDSGFI